MDCSSYISVILILMPAYGSTTGNSRVQIPTNFCTKQENCKCFIFNQTILSVDCSSLNLTKIPDFNINVTMIDLSNNSISALQTQEVIPANVTFLNMSHNSISEIYPDFFIRLEVLETLDLNHNNLNFNSSSFHSGVFSGLRNLKNLNLKNNNKKGASVKYPDMAFSSLLSLEVLRVDGVEYAQFGVGFRNLKQLSVLDMSSTESSIVLLKSDAFVNMPLLEEIDISHCNIHNIENGTFQNLSRLKSLDISYNVKLTFAVLSNVTFDLQFTSIAIFKANVIHKDLGIGTQITLRDTDYLKNTNLTELYLDRNRLEMFEFGVLSHFPKSLYLISLAENRLMMGLYYLEFYKLIGLRILNAALMDKSQPISKLFPKIHDILKTKNTVTEDRNIENGDIRRLASISMSYQRILGSTKTKLMTRKRSLYDKDRNVTIYLPPNLETLFFNHSIVANALPKLAIQRVNNFKYADLSHSFIYKWEGPISNVFRLQYFDLSNNFCTYVSPLFFRDMTGLKTLRIGNNFLGFVLDKDVRGGIFNHLKNLRYLELSVNKILTLPRSIFRGLTKLESLNLSGNLLSEVDFSFQHMKNLKYLDLSRNELSGLPISVRTVFDTMWSKNNLKIYLQGNRIQCSCDALEFLQWVLLNKVHFSNFVNYTCNFDNGTKISFKHIDNIVIQMQLECLSKAGLIVGTSIGIVVFLLILAFGVIYRYRWKLRYIFYISINKNRRYTRLQDYDEEDFRYDAFISYADEQKYFVIDDITTKLEKDRGYRLCIHHRDFIPGTSIHDNMANAIRNSRRTIVILSKSFIRSTFCMWEFNMAKMEGIFSNRNGGNVICLIYYEKMPPKELPLAVLELIQSKSYIEYPVKNENDIQIIDLFWEKIAEAISGPG